jgi:pheromone shutdown protein TraB
MPERLGKPELPPNVVIVELPEGRFRIAYGVHRLPQNPKDVKGVNAIMLESGSLKYYPEKEAEKAFDALRSFIQYRNIIGEAAAARQPIYLTDIDTGAVRSLLTLRLLPLAEGISAAVLILRSLFELGHKILKTSKTMTRRDFLKLLGTSSLAAYFGTQLGEQLGEYLTGSTKGGLDEKTAIRKIYRFLIKLNEMVHPETHLVILTLRNLIMAQKLITIARDLRSEIGRKPEIGVVVGGAHIGIEGALKLTTKERMNTLRKILSIPGLKDLRENVAAIARFDYDPQTGEWWLTKFYKDPSLLNLES